MLKFEMPKDTRQIVKFFFFLDGSKNLKCQGASLCCQIAYLQSEPGARYGLKASCLKHL